MPTKTSLATGFLFRDVQWARLSLLDKLVRAHGVTGSQSYLLAELFLEDDLTQSELAGRLGVGLATLGGLVDRLAAAGFVERHPDPVDRRVKRIRITPAAAPLRRVIKRCADQVNGYTFGTMSAAQIDTFMDMLNRINANLRTHVRPDVDAADV